MGNNDTFTTVYRQHVEAALHRLGIRVLVFALQDPSFPPLPEADTGRGSPYSTAGLRLLRFVRALGFNAVQFGPQGETSRGNASPYDSTVFSRSTLSIALDRLVEEGLLRPETLARLARGRGEGAPMRTQHTYAVAAHHAALTEAVAAFHAPARSAKRWRGSGQLTGRGSRVTPFTRHSPRPMARRMSSAGRTAAWPSSSV